MPDEQSEVQALRARLLAEEKRLSLVREIGLALSSALDLDRILELIMERITLLMEADRSTLYLLTDDGRELWSKVAQGAEIREIKLKVGEGISGWVAASGETVNIPDAYVDKRFYPAVDLRSGYRTGSILCVPMRSSQGATIGVMQVLNKRGGVFTRDDESLLAALTAQAAVAIENAKLYHSVVAKNVELLDAQRQLEQRSHELHILFEIEQEMNAAAHLDELLDRLLRRAMEVIGARAGSILLRERGSDDLHFRSAAGEKGETMRRLRTPMGQGIVGWVAERRTPLIVNEPASDPRHDRVLAERIAYQPRNLLCAPLVSGEETLGAIELIDKDDPGRGFDEGELKLLVLIAGQASKAIQLARAKEEQLNESRLASIGQMLSGVLHDLKTPMTVVSGYAQLMAQMDDAGERAEYVEHILKQFELMSAMTREVLAFARGETNVLVRKVYLNKYLAEVESHLRHEFAGRCRLVIEDGYRGVAFFDEQKMLRVIHNLARNALEAMGAGGVFQIGVTVMDDRLVMTFADNGPGIPAALEGRVFEPFATLGKKDGTGLGLAIVKKIVEEHKGQVSYVSRPGEGTTFTIDLPLGRPGGDS